MNNLMTGFQFCEQQVEDVLRAIDTIEPVIGTIRKYFEIRQALDEIKDFTIEANGKIKAYQEILELNINKAVSKEITSKLIQVNSTCETLILEQKELSEYIEDLAEDLSEYSKYIDSFDWLNLNLAKEVFYRIPEGDKSKVISFLILFTKVEEEREEIYKYLCEIIEDEKLITAISEGTLLEYIINTEIR